MMCNSGVNLQIWIVHLYGVTATVHPVAGTVEQLIEGHA